MGSTADFIEKFQQDDTFKQAILGGKAVYEVTLDDIAVAARDAGYEFSSEDLNAVANDYLNRDELDVSDVELRVFLNGPCGLC